MPTPTSTSMSDINSHIGSARNSLSDGLVRNLANQGGTISYSQCRWGIQFPAYKGNQLISGASVTADYSSNDITLSSYKQYFEGYESISNFAQSAIYYRLSSNGTGLIRFFDNETGDNDVTWTWLQSGSAGEYTARFDLSSGFLYSGSSATGTDLSLSTTREWIVLAECVWGGFSWSPNPAIESAAGTLVIKDSGGSTLISRPLNLNATAQVGLPF